MVAEILGVVNEVPVAKLVPPVKAAYQSGVPALAVAPNTNVPVPQRVAGVVEEIAGIVLIIAIIALRVEEQPLLVASA